MILKTKQLLQYITILLKKYYLYNLLILCYYVIFQKTCSFILGQYCSAFLYNKKRNDKTYDRQIEKSLNPEEKLAENIIMYIDGTVVSFVTFGTPK